MKIQKVEDKEKLFSFFSKDFSLYGYHIGDLDDFYFNNCTWYGLIKGKKLTEVVLFYAALETPTLLIFGQIKNMKHILNELTPILPSKFYCHFFKGYASMLTKTHTCKTLGTHIKMKYEGTATSSNLQTDKIRFLSLSDQEMVKTFYNIEYPGNYFDSRMLETGKYLGLFIDNNLVSITGVHVFSKFYKIAILGNIATKNEFRNLGYATELIKTIIPILQQEVDFIGLNVKKNNYSAIKVYKKLGFVQTCEYEEALFYK